VSRSIAFLLFPRLRSHARRSLYDPRVISGLFTIASMSSRDARRSRRDRHELDAISNATDRDSRTLYVFVRGRRRSAERTSVTRRPRGFTRSSRHLSTYACPSEGRKGEMRDGDGEKSSPQGARTRSSHAATRIEGKRRQGKGASLLRMMCVYPARISARDFLAGTLNIVAFVRNRSEGRE